MKKLKKKLRKNKGKKSITTSFREKKERLLISEAQQHAAEGRLFQARDIYLNILERNPNNHEAWYLLAKLYESSREFPTAEKYLLNAVRSNPKSTRYLSDLANVYCNLQHWDKALEINQKILQDEKDNVVALNSTGIALKGKGEIKESIYFFERVSGLQPKFVGVYISLCSAFHRLNMTDKLSSLMNRMENLLPSLNNPEKATMCLLLGKYYDILDNYKTAFSFIEKGNKLKWEEANYTLDEYITLIKKVSQNVTANFLAKNKDFGTPDYSPIFIVGMPRSGTSLLEQILSCHPDIKAGGEMYHFYGLASNFDYSNAKKSCAQLAQLYIQYTASAKNDSKYFTDKFPSNFMFAGLIHLCFPTSKIIHCVRDPKDTCFSCYKQSFEYSNFWSYDLKTLGQYYNAYLKLMRHWHEVMPDVILDVKYENVVNNLEDEVHRILGYCNLPWNEKCLKFYNSSRVVETASQDQVTRPIYNSSVGRWKYYKDFLQTLLATLQDN